MDRAERRQRRLEQKFRRGERPRRGRGRGRGHKLRAPESSNCESPKDQPQTFACSYSGLGEDLSPISRPSPPGPKSPRNACGLQLPNKGCISGRQNDSQEDGTDGVAVYVKWQEVAAQRLDENKELRTEIQCLNLKIKQITEISVGRLERSEIRYRAEIKSLREMNDELIKRLDDWVNLQSSALENLTQILQMANHNKQSTHRQASQGTGNTGRFVNETKAGGNVCVEDKNNGHRESSKEAGNFERNGCECAVELNVDVEQRNTGDPQRQTQTGLGSKIAQQMHVDDSMNECVLTTEKSAYVEKRVHKSEPDMNIDIGGHTCEDETGLPRGQKKTPSIGNVRSAGPPSEDVSQILFTDTERKSALVLVTKEFIMWLSSRTRRPTSEEMSFHKSQVAQKSWSPGEEAFYWTGIPGSLLLDRFQADTEMEKPSCNALTTLLRSVLHIVGSKRGNDMLWCLVWADCMNPSQLPGYVKYPHDTKRARAADDDVARKSAKVRQS